MAGALNHPKLPLAAGAVMLAFIGAGLYFAEDGPSEGGVMASAAKAAVATAQPPKGQLPQGIKTASVEELPVDTNAQPQSIPSPVLPQPEKTVRPSVDVSAGGANSIPVTANEPELNAAQVLAQQQEAARRLGQQTVVAGPIAKIEPVRFKAKKIKATPGESAEKHSKPQAESARTPVAPAETAAKATPADSAKQNANITVDASEAASRTEKMPVRSKALGEKTPGGPAKAEGDKTHGYTEIKANDVNPNLTFAKQKPAGADSAGPTLVASAGDKAWIRISPTRTLVVKVGEELPGMGKVLSVSGSELVTEKGKFTLFKE